MRLYTVKIENGGVQRNDGIELVEANDRFFLGVLADGGVMGVPLSPYFSEAVKKATSRRLGWAEGVVTDTGERVLRHWEAPKKVLKGHAPDYDACLLLEVEGSLRSSMFIDQLVEGRVVREYLGAEPENMAGVDVLGVAPGKLLVHLKPGASFRLEDIPQVGHTGSMTIRWLGWDQPRPERISRDYLNRKTGLQLRTYWERKHSDPQTAPQLGLVAEG